VDPPSPWLDLLQAALHRPGLRVNAVPMGACAMACPAGGRAPSWLAAVQVRLGAAPLQLVAVLPRRRRCGGARSA
jgi:hypothetical protein